MAYNFLESNRDQMYLMPVSIRDWLPEGHLAWFIIDVVKEFDLTSFYGKHRSDGWGRAAYEPMMMVSLLLYAYSLGIRSSRQIERACEVDVSFRVITANQRPDYSTICRFRKENEEELAKLFTVVLELCGEAGLVKVGVVSLDGTKMKGNTSLAANRTYDYLEKEVKRMLQEADEADAKEDVEYGRERRGDELPKELARRESRLARLRKAKAQLEQCAQEKAAVQEAKIEAREEEEQVSGEKKRGRKLKEPDKNPDPKKAKANLTDLDSRIMKTRNGHIQGYNGQAVVTKEQIIVAAEVTQQQNDVQQLHPMLKRTDEELKAAGVKGKVRVVLADAGYYSERNMLDADPSGPELLLATKKSHKQRQAMKDKRCPRGRIPNSASVKERMERKLLTKRGKALYKLRSQTVEPVFGQIKGCRGSETFLRRGVAAVNSEWRLICATHNLLKLWRSGKFQPCMAPKEGCLA
ncbi:TPA: IS1182 family transposase [Candidatus Acetothermia bacterium]|nr:IS1182 family transposase [Candidatus Acetothermia bacterium]